MKCLICPVHRLTLLDALVLKGEGEIDVGFHKLRSELDDILVLLGCLLIDAVVV